MYKNILNWSEWNHLNENDREEFGIPYTNPRLDKDEIDRSSLDLFRDQEAERQARSDIHRELGWKNRKTKPEMDPLDRENPTRWVKTRITITNQEIARAIERLAAATGQKSKQEVYDEIDRLVDRLVYYKSVQKDIKAQEFKRRRL